MAFSLFYFTRNTLKKTHLPFTFPFILLSPSSFSSRFSTLCKKNPIFFSNPQTPPVPKKVPFEVSIHGVKWQDDYHWMSNINDPDFINYLDEENVYADGFMKDTEQIQTTLYSEMVSRMPSKISTSPELWGSWLYSQYIPEGKEYPVLCRKSILDQKNWMDKVFNYLKKDHEKVQTLLDWNAIAQQYGYVHVGTCRVSPDHNFLAYTIDTSGNENFCLKIKNIQEDRQLLDHHIEGVVSVAWAHDGRTLFYTSCDQNQRPCSVNYIKLDSEFVDPTPLFVENDPRFCVDITSTKDNKYITVNSSSRTSSEVYVIDAVNTQCKIQRFCKRISGVQYFLEHHDGYFYVLTNGPLTGYEIEGYYLARCRVENLESTNCQNLILPSEDICLLDMDIFNEHLVLHLNKEGSSSICSIRLSSFDIHKKCMKIDDFDPWYFPVPSDLCTVVPGSNHDFTSSIYRVVLSSPVMPDVVLDYDMSRKTYSIVHQEEVVTNNGVDSTNKNDPNDLKRICEFSDTYCCEKKEAYSNDGTMVPLTILYSRKFPRKNQSPGILHGYGAYGEVLDKSWCSDFLSLLDRGWVIAFADVRYKS